ncbi:hypothetical protein FF38_04165 [Lucilia cuprina]|uniref:Uncharacterized protein n=1 Tax=Lucilia cuprina TaxID=7375 RepID=A0A0L0C2E8_LUCCU|nr:hypothetical protein FF38_04165 [Lucilia cuprina]
MTQDRMIFTRLGSGGRSHKGIFVNPRMDLTACIVTHGIIVVTTSGDNGFNLRPRREMPETVEMTRKIVDVEETPLGACSINGQQLSSRKEEFKATEAPVYVADVGKLNSTNFKPTNVIKLGQNVTKLLIFILKLSNIHMDNPRDICAGGV